MRRSPRSSRSAQKRGRCPIPCGALSVVCPDAQQAQNVLGQLKFAVRRNYSSPPIHGGQIVASHSSHQLLGDVTVETIDLGEHRLKDLGQPERIFQIVHPALPRDFPPLRSLDAFPGNLPVQVTSFVGRDDDVNRAIGLLDDARLVTLAGTGGVGKTRLAVQVAAEVLAGFGDGAWFCELAPADDADTMAQVVASTLGCVQHPGLSLAASIVEYLKVRELLLVVDNCEQVLDDAGDFVDAVVRGCPKVTVLATSREALDVPGERVVRVRSLATPERVASDADLLDVPSVELFRDRARDAGAGLEWDARQWQAVSEICQRVDGIPLAIELAAARTVAMNPIDIAGHLDERFRLLTGKRRGRVERHQTLRATVEWSYQLLGDDERLVFDRLGTFAGSFDEAAAIAVAGDDGELDAWAITDALASLVAKSMLGTETGPGGETRYTMLETLRQYAREQLDEAGDTDSCRRAQARYLGTFARTTGLGLRGADDRLCIAQVRAELDNLRASIGWAIDCDDPDDQALALAILGPLNLALAANPETGLRGPHPRSALPSSHSPRTTHGSKATSTEHDNWPSVRWRTASRLATSIRSSPTSFCRPSSSPPDTRPKDSRWRPPLGPCCQRSTT